MIKDHQIYSIQILHAPQDLITAVCIQEFFKFCGICTKMQEADMLGKNTFHWDKVVIINKCIAESQNICIVNQQEEKAIEEVAKALHDDTFIKLAQIFNKNQYAKVNYQVHCFLRQMNNQELLDCAQSYYNCFMDLRVLEKEINQTKVREPARLHVLYALLTCARKINIICQQRGDLLFFDSEKMSFEASKLKKMDSDFFMGDVALALICFQDPKLWEQGIKAMERAILMGDAKKDYISFLRYTYAHFLEEEMNNKEKAREEYEKILDFHETYHRALYKQAYYLWKEQKHQLALDTFFKMTEQLERKWKSGWIQPIEIEYLYKGCMFIEHIAEEMEKYDGIPAYVFKVIADKNQLFDHSEFVKKFWKECSYNNAHYFEKKLAKYHV